MRRPHERTPIELLVVIGGPVAVWLAARTFPYRLDQLSAAVAGLLFVAGLSRRPGLALRLLAVVLPFQLLAFSTLYVFGLPAALVRPLGFWKEAMIGAVVVAAAARVRAGAVRFDTLDRVALAYVALASLFLFAPSLLADGVGETLPFGTRLNGFRTDAVYVLLFVAARHARIPAAEVVAAARAFVGVAVVVAAFGIVEFFAADTWNRSVTDTLGLTRYKLEVLGVVPGTDPYLFDIRAYSVVGGRQLLRIGGVLVDYLHLPFWLIVATAIALERQVRSLARPGRSAALGVLTLAVLFTQTRSAVIGLVIVTLITLRRQRGRTLTGRVRLALAAGALAVVVAPVAVGIGFVDRIAGEGDEHSDELHEASTSTGLEVMLDEPLGRGLATAAGAGQREEGTGFVVTENQLLQIGTQLGIAGLGLWVASYVLVTRAVRRAASRADGDPEVRAVAGAMGTVFLGLAASMMFLQIHIYFAFAWTLWGLAGASLGVLEASRAASRAAPQGAGTALR